MPEPERYLLLDNCHIHQIAIIKDGRLVKCGPTAQLVGDSSLETVLMELE